MERSLRVRLGRGFVLLSGIILAAAGAGKAIHGQEPGRPSESEAAQRFAELKRSASRYTIVLETDRPVTLQLAPEPVLRWSNPIVGATDGGVFLWTRSGRPEVVATVYRKRPDGVAIERHEFQSLAQGPLRASFDGRTIWAPREPGIRLVPIAGAPVPEKTRAGRLRQMRALAKEFQVEVQLNAGSDFTPLRLLTQPLTRYPDDVPDGLDGALMAFVLTTDPDAVLVIEATAGEGVPAWQYAFGRMSGRGLRARYRGKTVWDVPYYAISPKDPGEPFINIPSPELVP